MRGGLRRVTLLDKGKGRSCAFKEAKGGPFIGVNNEAGPLNNEGLFIGANNNGAGTFDTGF